MGRCPAPCDGRVDPEGYGALTEELVAGLRAPDAMLAALDARMDDLAEQERYEEAALVRDRLRALAGALERARRDAWLVRAGALELETDDGVRLRFDRGALTRAGDGCARQEDPLSLPCPRERADELAAVRGWLARHRVRVIAVDGHAPSEPVDGGAAIARVLAQARAAELAPPGGRERERQGDRARRLDWRAWTTPSSSRAPARPSGSSSVRSPGRPPSSSARWPPSRRCDAPTSTPPPSTRRSSATRARRGTARTPAAR